MGRRWQTGFAERLLFTAVALLQINAVMTDDDNDNDFAIEI